MPFLKNWIFFRNSKNLGSSVVGGFQTPTSTYYKINRRLICLCQFDLKKYKTLCQIVKKRVKWVVTHAPKEEDPKL